MLIYYILQTIELWIFVGILLIALVIEQGIEWAKNRNEELEKRINAEVDTLHR